MSSACGRPQRLLLTQRSWRLFYQNFVFHGIKVEIFRRYKFVIKIINSTVLNKLQSYSRISALGPEGHCTSRFKREMCISCRVHVDVHNGSGSCGRMWTWGEGGKKSDFLWTS